MKRTTGRGAASGAALTRRFEELRRKGSKALVCYLTAGYPSPATFKEILRSLDPAIVDVIEVGVPFSDPIADGPIIQASSETALANGVTLERTLELVAECDTSVPVVLFTYLNPLLAAGAGALDRISAAGCAGLLVTDLPLDSDPELEQRIANADLSFIRLVAPTTPQQRMALIARRAGGFVYLISRTGVTGLRESFAPELQTTVDRLRSVTSLPICIGFGISNPNQARSAATLADGIVVGSAFVKASADGTAAAMRFVRNMRSAIG